MGHAPFVAFDVMETMTHLGAAERGRRYLAERRLTLTVEQSAGLLGISRALAYDLVRRHELPALRLGRRLVVPRVALEEMLRDASGPTDASRRAIEE